MEAVEGLAAALAAQLDAYWPAYLLAMARVGGLLAMSHAALRRVAPISVQAMLLGFVPLVAISGHGPGAGGRPAAATTRIVQASREEPAVGPQERAASSVPVALIATAAAEFVRGAALGLAMVLVLWAIPAAGSLLDEHLGWVARDVLFPETASRGLGEWFVALGVVGVLSTVGGPDATIWLGSVLEAVAGVPPGTPFSLEGSVAAWLGGLLTAATVLALTLVAPLLAVLYAAELILVVVQRGWPAAASALPAEATRVVIAIVALAVLLPRLGLAVRAGMSAFASPGLMP